MATRAQINEELRQNISTLVGRIGADLIPQLRDATARDTGYHSSRWVGRIGGPPASRDTPNTRSGRAASLSFGQQNASISAVRSFRLGQGPVFVSNDGNFIEKLNAREGGFVQSTVESVVRGVSLAGTTLRR